MRLDDAALASAPEKLPLTLTYYDTGHSLDRGVEWIVKSAGRLLVLVNADPNPVDVTIGGLPSGHALRAQFAPYEVRLMQLAKS